jgi:hypothetical protein
MRVAYCRVNVSLGPKENRQLITGLHTVADIFCTVCDANLGWKYEMAYEETQKYKARHTHSLGNNARRAAKRSLQ